MILSFHYTVPHNRKIIKPTNYVTLEDTLDMPNIEEVDNMPTFLISENTECARLEEMGAEVLNKIYNVDSIPKVNIKCKGMSREEYRF